MDDIEEGDKVRVTAGRHVAGFKEDPETGGRVPDYREEDAILEVGKDISVRQVKAFEDKLEKVRMVEGKAVSQDETVYSREELQDMNKPVLEHIAHRELELNESQIGTEHSESDTPVKADLVDAILRYQ